MFAGNMLNMIEAATEIGHLGQAHSEWVESEPYKTIGQYQSLRRVNRFHVRPAPHNLPDSQEQEDRKGQHFSHVHLHQDCPLWVASDNPFWRAKPWRAAARCHMTSRTLTHGQDANA